MATETKIKSLPTTQPWQQDLGKTIAGLLSGSAEGLLSAIGTKETPESITNDWKELYATPAMQMWQKSIAPLISEGYNLPGSFYSRSTSQGLTRSASDFYTQNVTPTLFSALENFKNRNVQMNQIYANLLGMGSNMSTAQTIQNIAYEKEKNSYGGLIGAAAGLGLAAATGGMSGLFTAGAGGGLSPGMTGLLGGSLIGGAF